MQFVQSLAVITVDHEPFEEVEDFTYLRSVISKGNAITKGTGSKLRKATI